jgi:hypothetical protein
LKLVGRRGRAHPQTAPKDRLHVVEPLWQDEQVRRCPMASRRGAQRKPGNIALHELRAAQCDEAQLSDIAAILNFFTCYTFELLIVTFIYTTAQNRWPDPLPGPQHLRPLLASDDAGCALLMVLGVFVLIALLVALAIHSSAETARKLEAAQQEEARKLNEAHDNYRQMLKLLKEKPTDPDLRQRTLEWGRHYSNLTRQKQGVTVFDELALSNDIDAVCAGASRIASKMPTSPSLDSVAVEDRLSKIKTLLDRGAITEDEYSDRRKRILDDL